MRFVAPLIALRILLDARAVAPCKWHEYHGTACCRETWDSLTAEERGDEGLPDRFPSMLRLLEEKRRRKQGDKKKKKRADKEWEAEEKRRAEMKRLAEQLRIPEDL